VDVSGQKVGVVIRDVLVAPKIDRRLISVSKIVQAGGTVNFGSEGAVISCGGVDIPAQPEWSLFTLHLEPYTDTANQVSGGGDAQLWHARLGHRNFLDVRRLGELDVGVPKGLSIPGKCEVCEVSKHTHTSFSKEAVRRPKEFFEKVHADLVGPIETPSLGGHKYALGLTEERALKVPQDLLHDQQVGYSQVL
jgi:hypothetical protein